jgi:ketosteroid isomerase-like protein
MSHENARVAREVLEAIGRRDAEALVALADPEVEWHSLFALGRVYRGHAGTRQYMNDLTDAWEVGRAEVDDQLSIDDALVLVGRIHYRGKGSGVESRTPVGWVLEFRDGRILRFRAFPDPASVLKSAGVSRPA